jgi:hypothetical protein
MPMRLGGMSLGYDELEGDDDYDDDDELEGDDDDLWLGGAAPKKTPKKAAKKVKSAQLQRQVQSLRKHQLLMQKSMAQLQPSEQTQVLPFPRGEGGAVTVGAGVLATVAARPQRPFQTQRFAWPSTSSAFFNINQLTIGQENMFVQAGVVPAEIFAQTGVGVGLSGYIAWPGIDVTLQCTNTDTVAHPIQASIVGATLV